MYQVVEQTKEEKMAMYMKLPKTQIAEMLINCNDIITALTQAKNCVIPAVSKSLKCDCSHSGSCRYEAVIAGTNEICRHKE